MVHSVWLRQGVIWTSLLIHGKIIYKSPWLVSYGFAFRE